MKNKGAQNRLRIVESAQDLFYFQGFNHTSFTEIAEAAGVPRGNFYYYFKSKDEILRAVVDHRNQGIRDMLNQWSEEHPEPRDRLRCMVQMMIDNRDNLARYGCPLGSLNMELGKTQDELQGKAIEMIDIFLEWIRDASMMFLIERYQHLFESLLAIHIAFDWNK